MRHDADVSIFSQWLRTFHLKAAQPFAKRLAKVCNDGHNKNNGDQIFGPVKLTRRDAGASD